ncbi:MAG: ATP synthase F1 subunit delta [Patescibacteria group bacterium]|jgi:F-type H+-transporting ATPase subunit delta
MKISKQQYARSLYEAISDKSDKEVKAIIAGFVSILAQHHDLDRGAEIIQNFQELWSLERGELRVELTSARRLEPTVKASIVDYLKNKTGASSIDLQEKIDVNLIGGFVLGYNSSVLDGSLRNSLTDLKNKISN